MTVKQAGIDRREFLGAGAALAGLAALPSLAGGQERTLRARVSRASVVGAAHPQTEVWTYDGAVPGPELRFRQGERLRVELENLLPGDTTVHWHGVRVPNGMDGGPGLTQPPIKANGGRFVYEFALPDAGTYWYHPHLDSSNQVGRGVYAPLIVEEPEPPRVDRDVVWMLGDWRLGPQGRGGAALGEFLGARPPPYPRSPATRPSRTARRANGWCWARRCASMCCSMQPASQAVRTRSWTISIRGKRIGCSICATRRNECGGRPAQRCPSSRRPRWPSRISGAPSGTPSSSAAA